MINLLDHFLTTDDVAPFFVDCPWCHKKTMDQRQSGRSKTGVLETLFHCPRCRGSVVYRWAKDAPGKQLLVRDGPPAADRLAKLRKANKSKPDNSAANKP